MVDVMVRLKMVIGAQPRKAQYYLQGSIGARFTTKTNYLSLSEAAL
jgi:hypothetical protein